MADDTRSQIVPDEPFWARARKPEYQAETDRIHQMPEGVLVLRPLTQEEWDAYAAWRKDTGQGSIGRE